MILGRHGNTAKPDAAKGAVTVEHGVVFGVDVENVERSRTKGELAFDVLKEAAKDGRLKGMEEMREDGRSRQRMLCCVSVMDLDGRERG